MKKTSYFLFTALLLSISFIPTIVFGEVLIDYPPEIAEYRATQESVYNLDDPNHYKDKMVYGYSINDYEKSNVYLYDFTLGIETQLTFDSTWQFEPSIYEDTVVWIDYDGVDANYQPLYKYDLITGTTVQLATHPSGKHNLKIIEDFVLYEDKYLNKLFLYNLSTNLEAKISDRVDSYDIYGSSIVYYVDDPWDIMEEGLFIYDIENDTVSQISFSLTPRALDVIIYENYILWWDSINDYTEKIVIYDLNTQIERFVSPFDTGDREIHPKIYKDIIVWDDGRNIADLDPDDYRNWDIYGYSISRDEEFPIELNESFQHSPDISMNELGEYYISYMDRRNDTDSQYYEDIYYSRVLLNSAILDHVDITPSKVKPILQGETIQFAAQAQDINHIDISGLTYTWFGTDENGLFEATVPGIYYISATTYGIQSPQVEVIVLPVPALKYFHKGG